MINAYGILLIVFLVFLCLLKSRFSILFLFFLSLMQGSVILNSSSFSLSTYYIGLIVFIAFNLSFRNKFKIKYFSIIGISIIIFATLQTLITQKILFAGILLANTEIMTTTPIMKNLDFNISSFGQLSYLLLNITSIILIYQRKYTFRYSIYSLKKEVYLFNEILFISNF